MIRRSIRTCWFTAIILMVLHFYLPKDPVQAAPSPDAPLAMVNGIAITAQDLDDEINHLKAEMQLRGRPLLEDQLQALRNPLIDNLIDREVLYQEARSNKIQVRPQAVEEALVQLRERVGGASAFRWYMATTGTTEQRLRRRLDRGLAVRQLLRREAVRGIRVDEGEMRAFYRRHPEFFTGGERIRARHILIAVDNPADEDQRAAAMARVRQLQTRVAEGTPLAVLALDHSACPSRSRGGDLGYLTHDQMVKEFAEAVEAMAPGQISDIVTTAMGFHLIQVLDRKPPAPITYNRALPKIERTLRRDKEQAAVQTYVARLKRSAEIIRYSE